MKNNAFLIDYNPFSFSYPVLYLHRQHGRVFQLQWQLLRREHHGAADLLQLHPGRHHLQQRVYDCVEGPGPAGNGATQRGGGHGQTDRQYSQTQGSQVNTLRLKVA